jgi:hypothetical protein
MHMTSYFVVSIVERPLRPRPSGEKVLRSDNSKASKKISELRRGGLDVKIGIQPINQIRVILRLDIRCPL